MSIVFHSLLCYNKKMNKVKLDISSCMLHILAMLLMLLDHMWATVTPGYNWMTCLGRIAFPIFAFMTVEGYFHTHSFRKYLLRLLAFAVISEIPFNLMYGTQVIYPYHQNVIWTFILALLAIHFMETFKDRFNKVLYVLLSALIVIFVIALGFLAMTDYYGTGVATVLVFYFFRKRKWWCLVAQIIILGWINFDLIGGLCYPVNVFGHSFEILRQGFAILALIPIWLYKGRQGFHNKIFQYACYAFYPVHILILALIN